MRNALILAANTIKITFRKKGNIFVYLLLPVIVLLLLVNINSSGSSKLNIGVSNLDNKGKLAADFIASIKSESKYNVVYLKNNEINDMLTQQKVDCVLTIPSDFEAEIYNGSLDKLQITSIKGVDATGWIQSYVNYYIKNLLDISKASQGDKSVFDKIYQGYNAQSLKIKVNTLKDEHKNKSISQQGIGLITLFMLTGAITIAGFMLNEKKNKTYYRIFATPVSSRIYVMGNVIAGMFIQLIQSTLIVFSISKILKIDTMLPDLGLFLMLAVFGLVCVSVGVLLVAFSTTSLQSGSLATLIIVPTSMISGCFWSVSIMPPFMQKLSYFFPQRWLLEGIKTAQDTGVFLNALPYIAMLLAFAAVFFLIAIFKMKSNNNAKNFV